MAIATKIRSACLWLLIVWAPIAANTFEKDVAYGQDAAQRLDLSTPSAKGFPTIVFIHGGSLSSGDKADSDYKDVCSQFPESGIACANVNYRLAPGNKWPAQGDDVAAAVAWVNKNIASRGGDRAKLFVFGHSSGATLAALIAADEGYLAKVGLGTDVLRGAIPMGSIMCDDVVEQAIAKDGRPSVAQSFSRRADVSIWGNLDTYVNYWPFNHIHTSMPPYLFLFAEAEQENPPILKTNSQFVEIARSLGNTAEYHVLADRKHYSAIRKISEKDDPAFILVRDFVRKYSSPAREKK